MYWILDISGEEELNEVEIWAISENGTRVIINDSFSAEFYVQSNNQEEDAKTIRLIEGVKSVEIVNKNFKGKSLSLLKISTSSTRLSDVVGKVKSRCKYVVDVFEDDIRFSNQYIFKKGVIPSSWMNLDVIDRGSSNGYRNFSLNKIVSIDFEKSSFPQLKVLAFDAFFFSQKGSPDPERSPIIAISAVTSDNVLKTFVGEERILVNNFMSFVKDFDPDVIVGFNSNRRIIPFL
ncbi:MAG: 3'-5' exonuclease, partial [Nitrososphaeria archaeon]